ncbi:uncharacterized protein LOC123517609 [Portunus trituberculatus]|uniref:uncharacterized protein LOC123517609 n=1 Tax=Portunus trituberculatus TaxID=210409 RepID=UPI001E1CFD65|nr:uncharacterized protein LOC123517609 [Portunus trituberculatus]
MWRVVLVATEALRMPWVAVVFMAGAVAGSLPMATVEPSLYYINTSPLGSFLEKPGMTLSIQDAYITLRVKNRSTCRAACWSHIHCVAVAAVPDGEIIQCRLADRGPTWTNVTAASRATYTYWERSLPTGTYDLREDKMLYLVVSDRANFTAAKELCKRIPGHRLAITKTINQYETLLRIANEKQISLWVDLRGEKTTAGDVVLWGDDTLYSDSGASRVAKMETSPGTQVTKTRYYRLKGNVLHGTTLAKELCHPLCQAHPMGLSRLTFIRDYEGNRL